MSSEPEAKPQQSPSSEPQAEDEYIIWPARARAGEPRQRTGGAGKTDTEKIKETEAAIRSIVGPEVVVDNYTSTFDGLVYWLVVCNAGQAAQITGLDGVRLPRTESVYRLLQCRD